MKITAIKGTNIPPIRNIELNELGNVVIIAGANGSGKTNLKQAIVQTISNAPNATLDLTVQATRPQEIDKWGNAVLNVKRGESNSTFSSYMNHRTRGGRFVGNVIQIDSQRNVNPVNYQPLNLSTPDPDDTEIDTRYYLNPFTQRWQETVNKIFQKSGNRQSKIAKCVIDNADSNLTLQEVVSKYPDPFVPYQELFEKLLPGKKLDPIDPKTPRDFTFKVDGATLPFSSLSSGEQEVIKITFDLLSKEMRHCVFLIDEPELHLHPTLTFRLIETLKEMCGGINQFFFFTHSADLISTYYGTGNVYFIDAEKNGENEAKRLSDLDKTHSTLAEIMGENLGLFAVGKTIIFVEGENSSIDKLTYHAIAQKYFSEAYVTPIGGVNNMPALSKITSEIRNRIFGINFFMVRDRDGLTPENITDIESNGKTKCLRRRCIENYFLDAEILAKTAQRFCLTDTTLTDLPTINQRLKDIATEYLNFNIHLAVQEYVTLYAGFEIPKVRDLTTRSLANIQADFNLVLASSLQNRQQLLSRQNITQKFTDETNRLTNALQNQTWQTEFSGKEIFNIYCSRYLHCRPEQVRQAYLEIALEEKPQVFQDIIDIFNHFKGQ